MPQENVKHPKNTIFIRVSIFLYPVGLDNFIWFQLLFNKKKMFWQLKLYLYDFMFWTQQYTSVFVFRAFFWWHLVTRQLKNKVNSNSIHPQAHNI